MNELLNFHVTPVFAEMMIRFFICLGFSWLIIDRLYYRKSHRRDFYFTFLLTSIAIFFLVFFMIFGLDELGGKTSMGIGIGLFGIFSIMRYRTDTMPVREMTYMFVIVSMAVVNAIATSVTLVEILLTDLILFLAIWLCEKMLKMEHTRLVQYDRIELIKPERREELLADLRERLGVDVYKVHIGAIDMLRDMAIIRIYYHPQRDDKNDLIDSKLKLDKNDLSTV
ncbi:MAG: DUF4956 domain-containing protein [Prevotella sp.]|nr:DUF4956 domain-containing protein [Prevotella sp.]